MMQANNTARGWRVAATGAVVCLLTMGSATLAPTAIGQQPALIAKLKTNVKCSERDAPKQLKRNATRTGADLPDILTALDELSIDRKNCAEIRDAASDLARDLAKTSPTTVAPQPQAIVQLDPEPEDESQPDVDADLVAIAAAERMQQVLADADARASSLRFEVGPPPRNLTRSRADPQ